MSRYLSVEIFLETIEDRFFRQAQGTTLLTGAMPAASIWSIG
jgi:hypothetical protein